MFVVASLGVSGVQGNNRKGRALGRWWPARNLSQFLPGSSRSPLESSRLEEEPLRKLENSDGIVRVVGVVTGVKWERKSKGARPLSGWRTGSRPAAETVGRGAARQERSIVLSHLDLSAFSHDFSHSSLAPTIDVQPHLKHLQNPSTWQRFK